MFPIPPGPESMDAREQRALELALEINKVSEHRDQLLKEFKGLMSNGHDKSYKSVALDEVRKGMEGQMPGERQRKAKAKRKRVSQSDKFPHYTKNGYVPGKGSRAENILRYLVDNRGKNGRKRIHVNEFAKHFDTTANIVGAILVPLKYRGLVKSTEKGRYCLAAPVADVRKILAMVGV